MKTENLEQKLHDYYRKIRIQTGAPQEDEGIDDNMLARYMEGTASPDEVSKIESLAETNEQLKILLQTLKSYDFNEEHQTQSTNINRQSSYFLNIFRLHKSTTMSIVRCAACLIVIIVGSVFIAEKLKLSSEKSKPEVIFRGVTSPTNSCRQIETNKNDKVNN